MRGVDLQRARWLPHFAGWERLHAMLAVPYDRSVLGPFFQSVLKTLGNPFLKITPFVTPGAVIHLSRDAMIRAALADPTVTHLCMVDSDQVFDPLVLPRLVAHNVPVVAPVIVQRNGEPIPVAYREVAQDANGFWRHEPLSAPIVAYLSQYDDKWWANAGSTGCCPLLPEHPPLLDDIPADIAAGLHSPLLEVDAVGCGMVVFRRDVLEALQTDSAGLYCGFANSGEDFDLCRRVRAAGWGGLTTKGIKGHGVYLDRGALVGHVTHYARGVGDMIEWLYREQAAQDAQQQTDAVLPPASDLLTELEAAG